MSRTVPRKKYGIAWKNVAPGSTQSSQEPRSHPIAIPTAVPSRKLTTVATPRSPSVHGRAAPRRLVTGSKLFPQDTPRLPWIRSPQ
jgi:hypothetical protein